MSFAIGQAWGSWPTTSPSDLGGCFNLLELLVTLLHSLILTLQGLWEKCKSELYMPDSDCHRACAEKVLVSLGEVEALLEEVPPGLQS